MTPLPALPGERARPGWDDFFLGLAVAGSSRGDCRRKQVGSIIVDQGQRIIGHGYNGTEPGGPSCLAGDCPRGLLSYDDVAPLSSYAPGTPGYCHSIHSEDNAIRDARRRASELLARAGTAPTAAVMVSEEVCSGTTIYTSYQPCETCMRLISEVGIVRTVWADGPTGPGEWIDPLPALPPRGIPGAEVLGEVAAERVRQDAKWGEQNHADGTGPDVDWCAYAETMAALAGVAKDRCDRRAAAGILTFADILMEEVAEAFAEDDEAGLEAELIQVAAVSVQWVQGDPPPPGPAGDDMTADGPTAACPDVTVKFALEGRFPDGDWFRWAAGATSSAAEILYHLDTTRRSLGPNTEVEFRVVSRPVYPWTAEEEAALRTMAAMDAALDDSGSGSDAPNEQ